MADAIRQDAERVLQDLGLWRLPVEPLRIIQEEGIELASGDFGPGFDARIEYFPEYKRFGIYYQQAGGRFRSQGRVNFSLAHEVAHFYLPEHRKRLQSGIWHNSLSDFGSKIASEKEADRFAAHLLMPQELFIKHVNLYHSGICNLKNLGAMAAKLGTSLTSTALRYCDCGIDSTLVLISKDRIVQWSLASPEMKPIGTWFVESGSAIPAGSRTASLYQQVEAGSPSDFIEGSVDSHIWFEWPKVDRLWEEAKCLGGFVLTYLAVIDT
jgi:hypothetical protein